MNYKIFVANLTNLNRMKSEHKKMCSRLEDLIYLETGVKGISYDNIMVSHNPSLSALKRLDMVDKVDDLCREINWLGITIDEAEKTIKKMTKELQQMLKCKFQMGMSYEQVGLRFGYSKSGIQYRLMTETERYL